ncbi:MarR family winged helix-turn-helix transcriptional regulator [Nocardia sp. NPDC050710]|uniref:MarR family winged helix-turn-helix transcriptional regulator n=1 Tax=Nocardia sp. NPDC050710 TaxID=3157220 RepID=UPI0033D346DF
MDDVDLVERAMVTIRRRQNRRTLAPSREPAGQAFDVLDVVESMPDATVSAVASALGADQPRVSRLISTAVDMGYIERVADQRDGRRSKLVLTDSGQEVVAAAHRRRAQIFAEAMDDWTAAERAQFATLLTRFVERLPNSRMPYSEA